MSVGTEIRGKENFLFQQVTGELVQVSIVIPVYNSEATLVELVDRLFVVLKNCGTRFEIILVDDGSADGSWKTMCELQCRDPEYVVAIQLMRNYGQHNALMCGFRHVRGQYVVTMDDDLQNPPEEVPKLLSAVQANGWDVVYGAYRVKKHARWRNLGSWLVHSFHKLAFKSSVGVTTFRVVRRQVLESILSYKLNFTYVDGLLGWNTQRVGSVLVEHHPRADGRSGYSLKKLLALAFNLFTNFSLLPLQIVSAWGLVSSGLGLLTGLYYLLQTLVSGISVPGYASVIIAILVLGGTQLLALGIMGEYLGRLHLNVNRKPQYVERQVLGSKILQTPNLWKSEGVFASESSGSRHLP